MTRCRAMPSSLVSRRHRRPGCENVFPRHRSSGEAVDRKSRERFRYLPGPGVRFPTCHEAVVNNLKNLKSLSSLNPSGSTSKFCVEAQNLLGECYELYSSSYTDLEEAAHWYLQASRSGHARATFNLGNLYETGQGVTKDFKKAVNLYHEAITRGSDEATLRIKELQELDLV